MASGSNQSENSQVEQEEEEEMLAVGLAYKDQGYHEMEFSSGNWSELVLKKQRCQKNAGHLKFIPASIFTIEHLPECWRDSILFDVISTVIYLTVRLAVKYTSKDRPPGYPLYNRRGQYGVTAYGSGWVYHQFRNFAEKDGRTCPCKACKQSPHLAKTQWSQFGVLTACHVVFDSSEAQHTRCDLFFDRDEDRYNCPCLEGVKVGCSNLEEDHCYVICISHDEELSTKLEKKLFHYWTLQDEVYEKFPKQLEREDTSVVISHPHGLCKHVTVGEVTHTSRHIHDKWKYSSDTCPGSSGAPLCILGYRDNEGKLAGPCHAIHSGCRQKGHNESTQW